MYDTSAAYKAAQLRHVRESRISGTLGTDITLSDSNIAEGSLYYDNQLFDDDSDISIGTCCIGELGLILQDSSHNRDYFFGKAINLTYSCNTGTRNNPVWEDIPIGRFTVTDGTERISPNEIQIVAYDNMAKFDVAADKHIQIGTAGELLTWMCGLAGVGFGGIDADLPNQAVSLTYSMDFYAEYIVTIRDAVKYICQLVCGYGTIGRDGKLYVRSLVPKATPDLTIDTAQRKSTRMSDKAVTIAGVSVEVTKYLIDATEIIQYPAQPDAGKILQLSDNPFLQQMSSSMRKAVVQAIAETAMQIAYRPTEICTYGDASIDTGDTLRYTGYICGDGVTSLVTHLYWRYRGTQELQSVADMTSGVYVPDPVPTDASDYRYEIVDGSYVRITLYIGSETYIIVPATIDGLPVTQLCSSSFMTSGVRRVIIPDGVEVIA